MWTTPYFCSIGNHTSNERGEELVLAFFLCGLMTWLSATTTLFWGNSQSLSVKVSAKAGRFHSWPETNTENLEMQLDPLQNRLHLTNITQVWGKLTNYNWKGSWKCALEMQQHFYKSFNCFQHQVQEKPGIFTSQWKKHFVIIRSISKTHSYQIIEIRISYFPSEGMTLSPSRRALRREMIRIQISRAPLNTKLNDYPS